MKIGNCRYVKYIMNKTLYSTGILKVKTTPDKRLVKENEPHLMLVNKVSKRRKSFHLSFDLKKGHSLKIAAAVLIMIPVFALLAYFLCVYPVKNLDIALEVNGESVTDSMLSYATLTFDGQGSGDVSAVSAAVIPVVKTLSYVIKPGDTISGISKRYNLDEGTLISFNKISNVRRIIPGNTLKIPDIDGIPYTVRKGDTLEKISGKYQVPLNAILDANDLESEIIEPGTNIFIPGARISDYEYKKATGTLFIYPTRGRLTSPFGYRIDPFTGTRRMHYGIDLANRIGTPVRASMSGTVVVIANHPQGYGNYIVIRHERGYQSLYGHLDKILVRKGQRVSQGQKIGLMGSTGRSTGPHLHFSLYKNYVPVNPLGGYLYK